MEIETGRTPGQQVISISLTTLVLARLLVVTRCHPKQRKNLRLVWSSPYGGFVRNLRYWCYSSGLSSAGEATAATGLDVCLDFHVFFLELANLEWKLKFSNCVERTSRPTSGRRQP